MGEVYRARDTTLDREVALKTLPEELAREPDRLARLKQEARILASLNHPGIAILHGLEESDRLNITGTVELPFGEGKKWVNEKGLASTLLGGWSITVFGAYQSGFPVAISQSNNNTGLSGNVQRPNQASGDPGTSGSPEDRLDHWFNLAAWTEAEPYTLGNQPRTDTRVRTPFKKNWDVSFQKNTRIGTGGKVLTLRLELINAFNDPNFLGPNTSFGSLNFGSIIAVRGFPRLVQLMVRFAF